MCECLCKLFLCSHYSSIDLFRLYVLYSHFRPCDSTRGNSFFQMSSYAHANVCITTNAKNKRKIFMRASRGLKWENKMYKLKWSILRCVSPTHQKPHVHLKKFIYILSLTLQHFLFPNTIKNCLIFYTNFL